MTLELAENSPRLSLSYAWSTVRKNLIGVGRLNNIRRKMLNGDTNAQSLDLTRKSCYLMFTQFGVEEAIQ